MKRITRQIRSSIHETIARWRPPACRPDWEHLRAARAETIAFSHPEYLGVTQSTRSLFEHWHPLAENDLSTAARIHALIAGLGDAGVRTVVLSGFAERYADFLGHLRQRLPSLRILVLWHGSVLQNIEDCNWSSLRCVIDLARCGVIDRVGFLKEGMAELIARTGIEAAFVMNYVDAIPRVESDITDDGRIHLGLWAAGPSWRKNPFAMVSAAALVDDAILTGTLTPRALEWCRLVGVPTREIYTKPLERSELMAALSKLHLNLYVTLSECSPLLPLESLSLGVPCLISATSHLFAEESFLESQLVVTHIDDPRRIARQIRQAVEARREIIAAYSRYAVSYNRRAKQALEQFIAG